MEDYDEDLNKNKLYLYIKSEYNNLFVDIIKGQWLLCLPKSNCLSFPLGPDDVLQHVLIPQGKKSMEYKTLKGLNVEIEGSQLVICSDDHSHNSNNNSNLKASIIFSEAFYDKDYGKFNVLCLSRSLTGSFAPDLQNASNSEFMKDGSEKWESQPFGSFSECLGSLMQNSHNCGNSIDDSIHQLRANEDLDLWTIDELANAIGDIYKKSLLDISPHLKSDDPNASILFEISLESYLINKLHDILMINIIRNTAFQNKELNCKIVQFSEIELSELSVEFEKLDCNLLLSAKYELASVSKVTTPISMLSCLKDALNSLNAMKNYSSDQLIVLLSYLIIKTRLPLWCAYLNFVKYFRYSSEMCLQSNKKNFLLCTLEASFMYIQATNFEKSVNIKVNPTQNGGNLSKFENLKHELFQAIYHGNKCDVDSLSLAIKENYKEDHSINQNSILSELCHPLCFCTRCSDLINSTKPLNNSLELISEKGFSPLHIASQRGHVIIVEKFLKDGDDVETIDKFGRTPLHWAALKGHQNTLLFLLNSDANLCSRDSWGNSPFHLAVAGGQEICVKAIIFYTEMKGSHHIFTAQNNRGDTPLHLAAFWGYSSIAKLIIEQMFVLGLDLSIKNKFYQTALDSTQDSKLRMFFKEQEQRKSYLVPQDFTSNSQISISFQKYDRLKCDSNKNFGMNDKLKKVFNAISNNDDKLVYFYLGIDNNQLKHKVSNLNLCHPLCQCERCNPFSSKTLERDLLSCIGIEGHGVLHCAVLSENYDLCETLLLSGANVNLLTKDKKNILHLSVQKQNLKLVSRILDFRIDVNIADACGNTPLHLCCICGWYDGASILLKSGANNKVFNKSGLSPSEEAENRGYLNIVRLLLKIKSDT